MNRLATLLVLALSLPLQAHADDASHRAKAQQLMTLLHAHEMTQRVSDNIKKQLVDVTDNLIGTDPTPEKKAQAADFVKQGSQMIDAQLSWEVMQSGLADIYVKNFTEEQMDAIIAFYKSPAGAALLANMPTVNTQVSAFGNQRLNGTLRPQLQQLVASFKEKVAPAAAPLSPAAAPLSPAAAPAAPAAPVAPLTPSAPAPAPAPTAQPSSTPK